MHRFFCCSLPWTALLAHMLCGAVAAEPPIRVHFGKQIRTLLAERCYECHGPERQEGGLRLDRRDEALRGGDNGPVIQKGSSRDSQLWKVLVLTDVDQRMPLGKKPLSSDQIALVARWVDEGAEWPDAWSGDPAITKAAHWSFQPLRRPKIPASEDRGWIRTPIDAFVFARLQQQRLSPSAEADRYTLVRRLYLDLLGLQPTPAEADAFAADSHVDAYERLVDQLLASPRYGERWARRWLDLARYADTNGYEKDRPRSIWPYRDWVVRALNADLPFDQFTIKQLAGDMLPNATWEDHVATGFHRNTMLNEEGGIDPLEFRFLAMVDRVSTTGTAWLGLTIGCAQCHTHKYDPIEHREYYQFMAFLDNADELDMEVADDTSLAKQNALKARFAQLTADLPNRIALPDGAESTPTRSAVERRHELLEQKFREWEQVESAKAVNWIKLGAREAKSNLPYLTILDDQSVLASGDQTKSDTYDVKYAIQMRHITAIRLEALPHDSLPLHGPGRAYYEGPKGDFFLSEFRAQADGRAITFKRATHDYSQLAIGNGDHGAQLTFDGNTTTGWSTKGREGEPHAAVYVLERPTDIERELSVQMLFERHYSCGLGRFRISVTTDEQEAESRGHAAELEAILKKPPAQRTAGERDQLLQRFLAVAPEFKAARDEIQKLRDSFPKSLTTLVLVERPSLQTRATFVHHRGEFLQPKERVGPAIPAFLPSLPASQRADRLDLAHWLVSPDNPLTARVIVNRQWQGFFGLGLVRTIEDFGLQGESPSHPELLDWLAAELFHPTLDASALAPKANSPAKFGTDLSWSLKRLHRTIVCSATYRQTSRVTSTLLARDPENVLLARGPRVRLEAEMIRDCALQAAGLLSTKMGGPGVFPPQPASITTEGTYGALAWKASEGEDRFRRGLYTYMKRTAPFALYQTFDAPSGEACLARRDVSNSPLQALALLNNVMFLEAAQALAQFAVAQAATDEERASLIFRRCLTRPPDAKELSRLMDFARAQRMRIAQHELDARQLAGAADGDLTERATWTTVARAVLNLHEAVTKP